jgi:hypothetical protein
MNIKVTLLLISSFCCLNIFGTDHLMVAMEEDKKSAKRSYNTADLYYHDQQYLTEQPTFKKITFIAPKDLDILLRAETFITTYLTTDTVSPLIFINPNGEWQTDNHTFATLSSYLTAINFIIKKSKYKQNQDIQNLKAKLDQLHGIAFRYLSFL